MASENEIRSRFVFHEKVTTDSPDSSGDRKTLDSDRNVAPFNLSNVCWLIGAMMTFYLTEFPAVVMYDHRVHRTWLNIGFICIFVTLSIAAFCVIYLSYIKKISSDYWEQNYPAAIPIATASFIFGSFCLMMALWPVWSFATPFILFTLFMGVVVTIAVLPAF